MKKLLTLALTGSMFMGLVGCGSEISYEDAEINVYTRDTSSGTREGFFAAIDAADGKSSDDKLISGVSGVTGNGDMINKIKGDDFGIGYISLTSLEGSGLKGLKFNGVEASEANVLNGTYEMSRYFSYVAIDTEADTNESKFVNELIKFIESEDGILTLQNAGIILDAEGAEPYELNDDLEDLSATTIKLGGSTSVESASKAITNAFSSYYSNFTAMHEHTGSGDSKKVYTTNGDMHIGFSSSGIRADWSSEAASAKKVVYDNLGQDAIVVVVNNNNPVTNLTTKQLQQIYVKIGAISEVTITENITKWDELV